MSAVKPHARRVALFLARSSQLIGKAQMIKDTLHIRRLSIPALLIAAASQAPLPSHSSASTEMPACYSSALDFDA
jgi:hypothetical protein